MSPPEDLNKFAEAIGQVCIRWAYLEESIGHVFLLVAGWNIKLPQTFDMLSCIDKRDQIEAIKVGLIAQQVNRQVVDLMFSSLNFINNELRNYRNRVVHDKWYVAEDVGAVRFNMTPRVQLDKTTRVRTLQSMTAAQVTLEEVREVISDIDEEVFHLITLSHLLKLPQDATLPTQLPKPPQRLHLLRQKEKQRQMDRADAKQKLQPLSSQE